MDNLIINNYDGGILSSSKSSAIYIRDPEGIRINNYEGGTIRSGTYGTIFNDNGLSGDLYIHNEGLIQTLTTTLTGCKTGSSPWADLICRSAIGIVGGGGATTIVNTASGVISSTNQQKAAIKVNDDANATITNYGEISGHSRDIYIIDSGDETGTTINLGGSPTFNNGIDSNNTTVNIVLQNDISAAFSVTIYDSQSGLSVTDNLPSNYTYTLTEPAEDLDSDGTSDDRVLSIVTVPTLSSSSPAAVSYTHLRAHET